MDIDALVAVLQGGGVVSFDGAGWRLDKAHVEHDMPAELREPLSEDDYDSDEWLNRQWEWWKTLEVCNSENTEPELLIQALCRLAGVRVRIV